jgi:2,4-dienoyl-CoA reductase-like NADH-dependent reductase (Old Yellow Enzyme family)/thioredoxin reductase
MAPIKLGYSDNSGEINEKHLHFYNHRSRHVGAVTPEPLYLHKGLREIPTQLGIDNDQKIVGLKKLTALLHANGTKAIAHLSHPGRMANPKIPGNFYVSSTDRACENGGASPKRMDEHDMNEARQLFVDAAIRARLAEFDYIELQFGHGYLLAQFLSPAVNDREDEFGGSLENRMRFPLSVFDAVKASCGLPINIRVSGDEMIPNGIKVSETIELVRVLEQRGAHAVHVSAGSVCSTPPWFFQHMFVPKGKTWEMAGQIKNQTSLPVIFVGRVNSISDIHKLQNNFHAEYIAVGRALVADPDFIGKFLNETPGKIRPCLACSEGCLGGVRSGSGLGCVVNPLAGHDDLPLQRAEISKNFAVIGGGLAGMEATLTLKQRGHQVTIYEKDRLGGQFNLAWLPPNKENMKEILDYFEYEIREQNIPVIYREATEEQLLSAGYDGVIIATGALPAVPPIKGLKEYYWAEFLLDENLPQDKKIVVIGGGLIGLEIASKLTDNNNEVIIVEMLDELARGMEMIEKTLTLKKLNMKNVAIYTNTKVDEIDGDKVFLSGEHQVMLEGIDKIVVATGMRSYHPLAESLKDIIPVHVIGDAKKVGKAQEAIRDGYVTATTL